MSNPLPLGRSLLLSLVLALGVACAWGAAMLWIVVMATSDTSATIEQLYLRRDGEPVILRYVDGVSRGFFTLDGKMTEADRQALLYSNFVQNDFPNAARFNAGWDNRLAAGNDQRLPATYWYLVHNGEVNGRAYGVGYDSVSKRLVGYFGRRGFSEAMPPESEWFPIAGDYGLWGATPNVFVGEPAWTTTPFLYVLAGEELWSIDLRRREVTRLLGAPWAKTVGWAWSLPEKTPGEQSREPAGTRDLMADRKLLLRSIDSAAIVDPQSGETLRIPLPEEVRHSAVAAFELADGNVLLVSLELDPAADPSVSRRKLLWLDPEGEILKQRSVELASRGAAGPGSLAAISWTTLLAEPMPLASGLLTFLYPLEATTTGAGDSYSTVLRQMLGQTWPSMLAALLIGVLAAVAAYWRQRRFGLPHGVAWAVFAFIFGVPGWLGYRFHRRWPPLEACPDCGQLVPRDRDTCRACAAEFPPPSLVGNEIFA